MRFPAELVVGSVVLARGVERFDGFGAVEMGGGGIRGAIAGAGYWPERQRERST
jgi:hypothetical protein